MNSRISTKRKPFRPFNLPSLFWLQYSAFVPSWENGSELWVWFQRWSTPVKLDLVRGFLLHSLKLGPKIKNSILPICSSHFTRLDFCLYIRIKSNYNFKIFFYSQFIFDKFSYHEMVSQKAQNFRFGLVNKA